MAPNLTLSEWALLPVRLAVLWARIAWTYVEAAYRVFVPVAPVSLRSRVVLVTGAGGGIGRATAQEFSRQGARLALWDVNKVRC